MSGAEQAPILEWARQVRFPGPVRWGDVEAEVLARAPLAPEPLPPRLRNLVALSRLLLWLSVAVVLGAPVVGLVVVVGGPDVGSGASDVGSGAFLLTSLVQLLVIRLALVRGRRRDPDLLVGAGVPLLASAAAVVVARVRDGEVAGPAGYALIAAGLAAVPFTLVVLSPSRASSRRPRRRGPRSALARADYVRTRREVLDVLIHRRLVRVDEADRQRLAEMPLGYWEELDDVDDAERRRILELRITGWREFTSEDERLWPRGRRRPPTDSRAAG